MNPDKKANAELLQLLRDVDLGELLATIQGDAWLENPDPDTTEGLLHRAAGTSYGLLMGHNLAPPFTVPPHPAALRALGQAVAFSAHAFELWRGEDARPRDAGKARGAIGKARARRAQRRPNSEAAPDDEGPG